MEMEKERLSRVVDHRCLEFKKNLVRLQVFLLSQDFCGIVCEKIVNKFSKV